MQDTPNQDKNEKMTINIDSIVNIKNPDELEKMKQVLQNTKRDSDWYAMVDEKFKTIFIEFDTITKHTHFKVRKELVEGVSLLILSCSK